MKISNKNRVKMVKLPDPPKEVLVELDESKEEKDIMCKIDEKCGITIFWTAFGITFFGVLALYMFI